MTDVLSPIGTHEICLLSFAKFWVSIYTLFHVSNKTFCEGTVLVQVLVEILLKTENRFDFVVVSFFKTNKAKVVISWRISTK